MAPRRTDYFNITELIGRGWTHAMIRDFLGRPDTTEPNPRFRNAPRTRLFARTRVEGVERTNSFAHRRDLAAVRSARAKAAARRRRMQILRLMAADEIPIPELSATLLEARAIRHCDIRTSFPPDPRTLNRWKVDYLRHHLTRYDPMIEGLFGRIGRADAERSLRRRVLEAITRAYPDLQDECRRQLKASERRRE